MTPPPPGPPSLPLLAVSHGVTDPPSAGRVLALVAGQSVRFRILPPLASGEVRIRIGSLTLSASVPRPIPAGSTGTAIVKRLGPPVLLQLTELSPPPPREPAGIPMLTGKIPLRGVPFPPAALERWNEALLRRYPPDLRELSLEDVKEGILLARFLSGALAAGIRREQEDGSAPGSRRPGTAHRDEISREDVPFWFFLPAPGERSPVLFPGHRRREPGEHASSWGIFLRLPDLGAVSVRFRPVEAGWHISFSVEREELHRALASGANDLAGRLRDKGFPLRGVAVRRMTKGLLEAEVSARMSRDMGLPLLERRA